VPAGEAHRAAAVAAIVAAAVSPGRQPSDLPGRIRTVAPVLARTPSSHSAPSISADGRFVAFASDARLNEADVNRLSDIYVLDRVTGAISLESPAFAEHPGGGASDPSISDSGRFVVYTVNAGGPAASHPVTRVILRDRSITASRVVQPAGRPLDGDSFGGRISADGTTIVFATSATNVEAGAAFEGQQRLYAVERESWRFEQISVDTRDFQFSRGSGFAPSLSADGRLVAFTWRPKSADAAVDRKDTNVYLRDRTGATTVRVGTSVKGGAPNGPCYRPAVSADGRYVAFVSDASDLADQPDRNQAPDVFVRDLRASRTELISRRANGGAANGTSLHPSLSADARFVVFQSDASDIVCAGRCAAADRDSNLVPDIVMLERRTGTALRISRGREAWAEPSVAPAIDGAGVLVAFLSRQPIDQSDDRDDFDLFVWERAGAADGVTAKRPPAAAPSLIR
jgi:Tol biopolymer transport system component